jgi:hypothetical protein
MPLKLTNVTLHDFTKGLLLSSIPKTFRDAIEIARFCEFEYIWINSLCIIQDSKEDWEIESAVMGQVYKNSFCNISASSAINSTKGFS